MDDPAKVLKVATREDGLAIRHVSTMVEDEDDRSTIGGGHSTGLDEGQVGNGMIIKAMKIDGAPEEANLAHFRTTDGAIGTAIHEGPTSVDRTASVEADSVGGAMVGVVMASVG